MTGTTAITLVLSLLSMWLSWHLFRRSQRVATIRFDIFPPCQHVELHPGISRFLKIPRRDLGKPCRMQTGRILVWNAGNYPIRRTDVPRGGYPTVCFEGATIAAFGIVERGHNESISLKCRKTSLTMEFDYLHPGDGCLLEIALTRTNGAVSVSAKANVIGSEGFIFAMGGRPEVPRFSFHFRYLTAIGLPMLALLVCLAYIFHAPSWIYFLILLCHIDISSRGETNYWYNAT